MGFILTILIIVALFWVLRLLAPYILLALVRRQQKRWANGQQGGGFNAGSPFGGAYTNNSSESDKRKEGEIRVEKNATSKQHSRNIGEYVDFEEES